MFTYIYMYRCAHTHIYTYTYVYMCTKLYTGMYIYHPVHSRGDTDPFVSRESSILIWLLHAQSHGVASEYLAVLGMKIQASLI